MKYDKKQCDIDLVLKGFAGRRSFGHCRRNAGIRRAGRQSWRHFGCLGRSQGVRCAA